jgi:hypothetical protein
LCQPITDQEVSVSDEQQANHSPEDAEDLELDDQAAERVQGGATSPSKADAAKSPIDVESFSFGGASSGKGSGTKPPPKL